MFGTVNLPPRRDSAAAAGLLVVALVELQISGAHFNHLAATLAAVGTALPLAWRRRAPLGVATVVAGTGVVFLVATGVPPPGLGAAPHSVALTAAWLVAIYSSAAYGGYRQALAALTTVTAVAVAFQLHSPGSSVNDRVAAYLFSVGVPWLAGIAKSRHVHAVEARRQAEQLALSHAEAARRAVDDERARIARELHDIVAHSLSVIVVHAAAERRLLDTSARTETGEVLATIERAGREALVELRRLLAILRRGDDLRGLGPQPRLADVDQLLGAVRDAGIVTELRTEGQRVDLPPGVELSAYRIVQEGITNVVKHASANHTDVVIRFLPDAVEVEVLDDGVGANGSTGGFGLVGARERLAVYGGSLEAGTREGGGFRLAGRFPIDRP